MLAKRKGAPTMTIESMVTFIYSHQVNENTYAMPFNKMYANFKIFMESQRKSLREEMNGRQIESATFTMTLFSVLYSVAHHPKGRDILKLFLANLMKIASEPSLPNVPSNNQLDAKQNLLKYFEYIHYATATSTTFRGIVSTNYDFSMDETPIIIMDADTIYYNALAVSLYSFVYALKEYESDPRHFVNLFFARNSQLEQISDEYIYKSFSETPMWIDLMIDY